MPMTDWCELQMLQALADMAPLYLGLFTVAPGAGGDGGTEVSGAGYARQAIPFGTPATDDGGVTSMTNADDFVFPRAESSWGEVSAWGVFDAGTGGHLLFWQTFGTPQAVQSGNVVAVQEACVMISVE